jgi:putative Holliday junction resolvase
MIHVHAPEGLFQLLPNRGRLLGLDLGTKTIGLALSDVERRIASAYGVIRRNKFREDAEALLVVCRKEDIVGLVIGLPLNMDGSEGPRAQATRAFVRSLSPLCALPLAFWDERLSTVAAERSLIAADLSRSKRANVVDATAASFILQGLLDRFRHLSAMSPPSSE